MPSEALVLVIVSFLLVMLIYGPTVTFAKPKLGPITCHTGQGVPPGQTECCQPTLSSITGRVLLVYCTTCDDTSPPSNCSPRYLTVGGAVGSITNPASGNNTGTQPFGGTIKVQGNPTYALPTGNNTGTHGKTSIFNPVRNVTSALPVNNNTGNPIAMTSSDNPPGCSKQNPIPPNCTLNPFNNSASKKAVGISGAATSTTNNNTGTSLPSVNVIKAFPGTIGNATNPSNNTGGAPPPPSTGLAEHHHKGSNLGSSTSSGNSTGH